MPKIDFNQLACNASSLYTVITTLKIIKHRLKLMTSNTFSNNAS